VTPHAFFVLIAACSRAPERPAGPAVAPVLLLRDGTAEKTLRLPARWVAEAPELRTLFPDTVERATESWKYWEPDPGPDEGQPSDAKPELSHCYEASIVAVDAALSRIREVAGRPGYAVLDEGPSVETTNWIAVSGAAASIRAERFDAGGQVKVCATHPITERASRMGEMFRGIPSIARVAGLGDAVGSVPTEVEYLRTSVESETVHVTWPLSRRQRAAADGWLDRAGFTRKDGAWEWSAEPQAIIVLPEDGRLAMTSVRRLTRR
jgi:hypothetical protein